MALVELEDLHLFLQGERGKGRAWGKGQGWEGGLAGGSLPGGEDGRSTAPGAVPATLAASPQIPQTQAPPRCTWTRTRLHSPTLGPLPLHTLHLHAQRHRTSVHAVSMDNPDMSGLSADITTCKHSNYEL